MLPDDEPSVLDYVKDKLAFWRKSRYVLPQTSSSEEGAGEAPAESQPVETITTSRPQVAPAAAQVPLRLPWEAIGIVFLGLLAQFFLEPPNRAWLPALFGYGLSILLIIIALRRGSLRPVIFPVVQPSNADDESGKAFLTALTGFTLLILLTVVTFFLRKGEQTTAILSGLGILAGGSIAAFLYIRLCPANLRPSWEEELPRQLVSFTLLILLTWLTFTGERFNILNGVLLLSLIVLGMYAVGWQTSPINLKGWFSSLGEPRLIRMRPYGLILAAVLIVTFTFRFTNLNGVPAEMFSDHAEKLYDVMDVLNGNFYTFFERNTGRELFQFYWTALMVKLFNTGISFMALKLGTVLIGLITLVYIYWSGIEIGGKWVALFALLFAAIGYWPNVISRIGLRFPLYAFCVAPVLYHLLRGFRQGSIRQFVWAGLWLGIGLHGYTASRIVPLMVLAAFILYWLHRRTAGSRWEALTWLAVCAFIAGLVLIPLLHFGAGHPESVFYRSMTRIAETERALAEPGILIFLKNLGKGLLMFFWDNGNVWVHSIPQRPALAVTDAGLFLIGLVIVVIRYLRSRDWRDLFLLVSIPILLLPSALSLAFPDENPSLNRSAGVYVIVFLMMGLGLESILRSILDTLQGRRGQIAALVLGVFLAGLSVAANWQLFFVDYANQFRQSAWNTSELGAVERGFAAVYGNDQQVWVVGYPHWVDTRLVSINAGYPQRNPELPAGLISSTFESPEAKLYMLNMADRESLALLQQQYPQGRLQIYHSRMDGKDFLVFTVPAQASTPLPQP